MDKRAFIIGNGKSLLKTDMSKLDNEITFGSNRIYLLPFLPTYYAVSDWLVEEDNHRDIQRLNIKRKFVSELVAWKYESDPTTFFLQIDNSYYDGEPLQFDTHPRTLRVYGGGTVTYILLQLAYKFGYNTVYLIGCDHNYIIPESAKALDETRTIYQSTANDDPNHFSETYFGEGKRFHDPNVERMTKAYIKAKQVYEADGRKIYNAGYDSQLDVFERVNYEELFNA